MDNWIDAEIAAELDNLKLEDLEESDDDKEEIIQTPQIHTSSPISCFKQYLNIRDRLCDGLDDVIAETRKIMQETESGTLDMNELSSQSDIEELIHDASPKKVAQVQTLEISTGDILEREQNKTQLLLDNLQKEEMKEKEIIAQEIREREAAHNALIEEKRKLQESYIKEELERQKEKDKRLKEAVLTIQSHFRGYQARIAVVKMKEDNRRKENIAAGIIQSCWRFYKRKKLTTKAVIKIQTCWRKYRQRCLIHSILEIVRENRAKDTNSSDTPSISQDLPQQATSSVPSKTISSPVILDEDTPSISHDIPQQATSSVPSKTISSPVILDEDTPSISQDITQQATSSVPSKTISSPVILDEDTPSISQDITQQATSSVPSKTISSPVILDEDTPSISHKNETIYDQPSNKSIVNIQRTDKVSHLSQNETDKKIQEVSIEDDEGVVKNLSDHSSSTNSSCLHTRAVWKSSSVWNEAKFLPVKRTALQKELTSFIFDYQKNSTSERGSEECGLDSESFDKEINEFRKSSSIDQENETDKDTMEEVTIMKEKEIEGEGACRQKSKDEKNIMYLKDDKHFQSEKSGNASLLSPSNRDPQTHPLKETVTDSLLNVETELERIYTLKENRSREEIAAQASRVRMSQIFSPEQILDMAQTARQGEDYSSRLKHATCPLSPNAWAGLVTERMKTWQYNRICSNEKLQNIPQGLPPPMFKKPSNTLLLSDAQLKSSSLQGTKIEQVTLVHIYRSRAPINLVCLSRCPRLHSLSLTKCHLSSFSDVGVANIYLQDIALPSNTLEYINFSELPNVRFLDLSDNRIASIHGLEKCENLLELNLDENRIARIGGLNRCSKLQKLSLEGNLIINSSGISHLPNLQYLSLAENHLPVMNGIEVCSLLQFLYFQQNNLQMSPVLTNHILLREINLSENSLSDISLLLRAWLPLLQTLNLSNNCISALESLASCVMLKNLHIQHNTIYDFPEFLQSVRGSFELRDLSIAGNPITEEPKFRNHLLKALPQLTVLDGEEVTHKKKPSLPKVVSSHPIYILCSRQIHEQDNMRKIQTEIIQSLQSNDEPMSPDAVSNLIEMKISHCVEYEALLKHHIEEQRQFDGSSQITLSDKIRKKQIHSALIIQKNWRGYRERHTYRALRKSTILMQSLWRGLVARRSYQWSKDRRQRRKEAAILIQSYFRGYRVRQKLREILSLTHEEDDEEDVEILLDESLLSTDDLKPLSPTEEEIDNVLYRKISATPPNIPQITVPKFTLPGAIEEDEHVILRKDFPVSFGYDKLHKSIPDRSGCGHHDTRTRDNKMHRESIHMPLNDQSDTSVSKTNKIVDEWGFSNSATADLMMKKMGRHRRLQKAANYRTKLQDPSERLSAFRRSCQGHHQPVSVGDSGPVYQWTHKKRVVHNELISPIHKSPQKFKPQILTTPTESGSETLLPRMEPHVLAGHTPRLVTARVQNDKVIKLRNTSSPGGLKPSMYNAWN